MSNNDDEYLGRFIPDCVHTVREMRIEIERIAFVY